MRRKWRGVASSQQPLSGKLSLNLVFLGAPGAGKGTQTKKLISKHHFIHLSTGDILRSMVKKKDLLGLEAKVYMDKGALVPDSLILSMIQSQMKESRGYIFDGFPRTLAQAKALDQIVSIDKVVFLDVVRSDLLKRLSGRRICKGCGQEFHIHFSPSSQGNQCDKCGEELYQRDDDREEVVKKRLLVYEAQTQPLIDYYKNKLVRIDGTGKVEEIFSKIEKSLSL